MASLVGLNQRPRSTKAAPISVLTRVCHKRTKKNKKKTKKKKERKKRKKVLAMCIHGFQMSKPFLNTLEPSGIPKGCPSLPSSFLLRLFINKIKKSNLLPHSVLSPPLTTRASSIETRTTVQPHRTMTDQSRG